MERKKREKAEQAAYKLEQGIALCMSSSSSPHHHPSLHPSLMLMFSVCLFDFAGDPLHNIAATSDPYKTLFVGRINYDTSESKLRREFETYGPVKKVSQVCHD